MFAQGDHIGAYTLLRHIGGGGMGEVYEARHRHIGRAAAIKILLPAYCGDPSIVGRLFNEAKAASLIHHAGVVEIFDCDVHPESGRAYIVMELLRGEDLGSYLRRSGNFAGHIASAAAITGAIADALAAAHAVGLTHRDLKPDNVFLAATNEAAARTVVKVLDFGVAKLLAENMRSANATRPGVILGTPLYMAPEQCRSAASVDHRADVYSLGCMLYEMIAGRPPFVGEGTGDLLLAHLSESPANLSSLVAEVPPALDAFVASMLAKDPDRRPQSMGEIVTHMLSFASATTVADLAQIVSNHETYPMPPSTGSEPAPEPSARAATEVLDDDLTWRPPGSRSRGFVGGTRIIPHSMTTLGQTATELEMASPPTAARRARPWVLATGGTLAAATLAVILWPTHKEKPRHEASLEPREEPAPLPVPALPRQSSASVTGPEAFPPPPAAVTVRITSRPDHAQVSIDGEMRPRGLTPLAFSLPRGAPVQRIVVSAEGYEPKVELVDGARDRTLVEELERQPRQRESKPVLRNHRRQPSPGQGLYAPVGD